MAWQAVSFTAPVFAAANAQALLSGADHPLAVCCVHPFNSLASRGEKMRRFLSAPQCIEQLAAKLADTANQPLIDGAVEALAVLITAMQFQDLADQLAAFNALFYWPDMDSAQRLAAAVAADDERRYVMPVPTISPFWQGGNVSALEAVLPSLQAAYAQQALTDSAAAYDANTAIADLQTQRAAHVAGLGVASSAASAVFGGGVGVAVKVSASDYLTAKNALQFALNAPGDSWPLCAGLLLVGGAGTLEPVAEVLGL